MTIETLLVTTDGSEQSEAAARRGFDLVVALDATVHVLSVADSSIATGVGYSGDSQSIRERLRKTATRRAASLREEATERGIEATAATRGGIPANEIVRYADEQGIDAICIGTAGRGGVARAVVGSVADKVVRTASMPVITITPTATRIESNADENAVLLPTDGSEAATEAAHLGIDLAVQLHAAVHLLSVVDRGRSSALSELLGEGTATNKSDLHKRANDHLEALASDARARGLKAHLAVRDGDPAEEIVQYADSKAIDLIALGTTGRGGFERLLVGSVADEVIRTAPVPVLTTRLTEPIE